MHDKKYSIFNNFHSFFLLWAFFLYVCKSIPLTRYTSSIGEFQSWNKTTSLQIFNSTVNPQIIDYILFPKLWNNGIPCLPLWWNPLESEDCSRLESPGCDVGLRTGPHSGMCWVNRVDSKGFGNGFLSEGRSRGHLTRRSSVRNSETKKINSCTNAIQWFLF